MNQDIYIYFDDAYTERPLLVGVLSAQALRGKEVFSFSFADEWLTRHQGKLLDPDLQLYSGKQYLPDDKNNFGIFLDSSPDRWGRVLLDRREGIRARDENRIRKHLQESDYLLGVFDECRMGALRMKSSPDGDFLDNDARFSTPPFSSLRELEMAVNHIETDEDKDVNKWLVMLLAPGSSLGGARPQANVRDADDHYAGVFGLLDCIPILKVGHLAYARAAVGAPDIYDGDLVLGEDLGTDFVAVDILCQEYGSAVGAVGIGSVYFFLCREFVALGLGSNHGCSGRP